jgi:hypothetical protein
MPAWLTGDWPHLLLAAGLEDAAGYAGTEGERLAERQV